MNSRTLVQAGYCLINTWLFISMTSGVSFYLGAWVALNAYWFVSALAALSLQAWGERGLLICSSLFVSLNGWQQGQRILFIIKNEGMDSLDNKGSPMAFLLVWIFTLVVFFLPACILLAWNIVALHRLKNLTRKCCQ